MCNDYSHLELFAVFRFGSCRDKCLVDVSIGQDRGQEPSNRGCPDHICAASTYAPVYSGNLSQNNTLYPLGIQVFTRKSLMQPL